MDFFKDFFKNSTEKGLPAIGGGFAAVGITNKLVKPMVADYRKNNPLKVGTDGKLETGFLEMFQDSVPGIVGLFLLNKKDNAWSYAGAGMIGAASAATGTKNFEFLQGDDSSRLADALDDIYRRMKK